jgi:hypothetical protein
MKRMLLSLLCVGLYLTGPIALLSAQAVRAATPVEQAGIETIAVTGLVKADSASRPQFFAASLQTFVVDPRPFVNENLSSKWEKDWGRLEPAAITGAASSHTPSHVASLANVMRIGVLGGTESCPNQRAVCAVNRVNRVGFSTAIIKGDSAQITVIKRARDADAARENVFVDEEYDVLLVRRSGAWAVATIEFTIR